MLGHLGIAVPDLVAAKAYYDRLMLMVRTRSAVHAVHDLVRDLGDEVLHEPQPWPQYGGHYYATFWLDPHGFMLEAVCHHDRD